MEKTTVFNLIILDESGSMQPSLKATIAGCNETINVAKSLQETHSDSQRALISVYAFQDNCQVPSRYLCKNIPAEQARHITEQDYQPWGGTPLLDAVGSTLVDLEAVASTHEDATAVVTIITDGMENASRNYSYHQVATIISRLKEKGWTFNFIGANIDVNAEAAKLNIDNAMAYSNDEEGTAEMWDGFNKRSREFAEERCCREANMSKAERIKSRVKASKKFFDF